jgi:hypothetical protein
VGFFREGLADALASDLTSGAVCPVIAVEGAVTNQTGGRRVSRVQVYGVDDRFWRFHGLARTGPGERDALVSAALAAEIGAGVGASILVRLERPSAIPIESLHGRKDQGGRTIRTTCARAGRRGDGESCARSRRGRAIFQPTRLQQTSTPRHADRAGRMDGRAGKPDGKDRGFSAGAPAALRTSDQR